MSITGEETLFRADTRPQRYGSPHPENGAGTIVDGWYFVITSTTGIGGLSGYVNAFEFDWLAERLGTPKLAEVPHG